MKHRMDSPAGHPDAEFTVRLMAENTKRLSLLLLIVILAQLVFILLEISGAMAWVWTVFLSRLAVIAACIGLRALIARFGKETARTNRLSAPEWLVAIVQLLAITVSCLFTVFMFRAGIYSFSSFTLACFVISLTCVTHPRRAGLLMFPMLFMLAAYLHTAVAVISLWYGELMIGGVFLLLLLTDTVQTYSRKYQMFIQDKELLRLNEKLQALSRIDELTGIYNRRKLKEVLESFTGLAAATHTPFCAAILDLDHFKRVNDEHGHAAGDEVLFGFANVIRFTLRSTDVFGRWGGEEFMILIPNCARADALALLENARAAIERHEFPFVGQMTFSAGISEYREGTDAAGLIEQADAAMYAAKRFGRNRVEAYEAPAEGAVSSAQTLP